MSGLGWRRHGSVENTKLSSDKQHTLPFRTRPKCLLGSTGSVSRAAPCFPRVPPRTMRARRLASFAPTAVGRCARAKRECCLLVLNLVSSRIHLPRSEPVFFFPKLIVDLLLIFVPPILVPVCLVVRVVEIAPTNCLKLIE